MKRWLIFCLALLMGFSSCQNESLVKNNRVVIAVSEDVESFNPLYAFSGTESNIAELLFVSLVQHRWDKSHSNISTSPMAAESWAWNKDSTELTIKLRNDIFWTDNKGMSAEDVVYSFDLYSDPEVQSRLYGTFDNLFLENDKHIDLKKSFEIISSEKLKIRFKSNSKLNLFDIDIPILPKHVFEKYKRSELQTAEINFTPVSCGAFKLKNWDRNAAIILAADTSSFLYDKKNISELIFKILPDYNSRIKQLRTGEVDLMEDVKSSDVTDFKKLKKFSFSTVQGRQFDFIGLSNIDNEEYNQTKKIKPHPIWGNKEIRKAIALAVNRKEILNEFLGEFGQLAFSPVTNIFISSVDSALSPYPYNLVRAKEILHAQGWRDLDNNGIIEKNGKEFSFKLYAPAGNPLREFAGTIIKNNLREVGIEVEFQTMELGLFIENVMSRKIDAFMAGWSVPLPIDLKPYWYSDLEESQFNIVGYQSIDADKILNELEHAENEKKYFDLLKKFEVIMHEDQPVIFLYWVDNIVVYSSAIKNIVVDPLGVIHQCWEWKAEK